MITNIIKTILIRSLSKIRRDTCSKTIYYHDIYLDKKYSTMGTPLQLFKKHLEIIKQNDFKIVKYIKNAEKEIMICLDDGFKGIWDIRNFIFESKIPLTIFVSIEKIGQEGYLTLEELLELQKHDITLQCHTWSHVDLSKLDEQELKHELLDAKQKLEELLNTEVDGICFPKGYFSKLVCEKSSEYGFTKLYSSIFGNCMTELPHNVISRNLVQFSVPKEFKAILFGGGMIFKKRILKRSYIKSNDE